MHPITESKDTFARLNAAAMGNVLTLPVVNKSISAKEAILLAKWREYIMREIDNCGLICTSYKTREELTGLLADTNDLLVGISYKVGE